MTTTRAPRAAATVRSGDIVRLDDGTEHTVDGTPTTSLGSIGGLFLRIRFTDGTVLRATAGDELDVVRPQ